MNVCVYCMERFPLRLKRYGIVHRTQPRACSKACEQRTAAWNSWVARGRNVRKRAAHLPSMPRAEAVERFRVTYELEEAA